jgi:hypothetical protein
MYSSYAGPHTVESTLIDAFVVQGRLTWTELSPHIL